MRVDLSQYMMENLVFLNIKDKTKEDVFKRIVDAMADSRLVEQPNEFLDEILKREHIAPTCIGRGVALPHTRTMFVESPIIAFARLEEPIAFSKNPKDAVQLIFLMGTPEADPNTYLKILAELCTLLRKREMRESLLKAESSMDILHILTN